MENLTFFIDLGPTALENLRFFIDLGPTTLENLRFFFDSEANSLGVLTVSAYGQTIWNGTRFAEERFLENVRPPKVAFAHLLRIPRASPSGEFEAEAPRMALGGFKSSSGKAAELNRG